VRLKHNTAFGAVEALKAASEIISARRAREVDQLRVGTIGGRLHFAPAITTHILLPNDVPSGATAWIAAAWVSQRGQRGTACNPVQVTIQGGPVLPQVGGG
jgi:hypothetical protein